ncbi:MAG: hypothetical protein JW709_10305 [Sedimentisphaerales bacterium]|nr:hypothetical protein [Sedimentisphaerales bacterium]
MKKIVLTLTVGLIIASYCSSTMAVDTVYITHDSEKAFKAGETKGVLINSEGMLSLGYVNHKIFDQTDEVWVFNDLLAGADGALYASSSPQGRVYKIMADGSTELLYGAQDNQAKHVFCLAQDDQQRLLMGTGGDQGLLLRRNGDGAIEQLFCHEDILYIWDIVVDQSGRIYLATGPKGQVIRLSADGQKTEFLHDAKEKNILTLALDETRNVLYAGGDEFGLVYRIDLAGGQTTITLDTGHEEIGKLLLQETTGNLYIATADPGAARMRKVLLLKNGGSGRAPKADNAADENSEPAAAKDEKKLAEDSNENKPSEEEKRETPAQRMPDFGKVRGANEVFEVTPDGFIQNLLKLPVIFFDMAWTTHGELLLATGNDGLILSLNLGNRQAVELFDVEKADQVTALATCENGVIYTAGANAATVWSIEPDFLTEGVYESEALDAGQISRWGTITANLSSPADTAVLLATRTGNTKDPEKGGWRDWSEDQDITASQTALVLSPPGRFLQYRLKLTNTDGIQTPQVSKITLAYRSPNLTPQVSAFDVTVGEPRSSKNKNPDTAAVMFKWNAQDDNKDEMKYELFLRPLGYEYWIRFAKDIKETQFKWNSRTAADGRYEFKITASDAPANPPDQALSDSRVSKVTLIDNTPPEVAAVNINRQDKHIVFSVRVKDALSPIARMSYCIDGGDDWPAISPDDGMFDTPEETAAFTIDDDNNNHLLCLQVEDERGNVLYHNIVVTP